MMSEQFIVSNVIQEKEEDGMLAWRLVEKRFTNPAKNVDFVLRTNNFSLIAEHLF